MILMCPYCGRKFVVPPHREKEPAQRCPNCDSTFEVSRTQEPEEAPAPSPRLYRQQPGSQSYPSHSISPRECEVVREVSRDGAGILYLARHPEVNGYVALKALMPEYPVSDAALARWTRISRLAESLEHPRLAKVLGVGLYEDVPCVVRQYVEGESLENLLAQGVVDPKQGVFLMGQVLEGLEQAHSKGVSHGNIKPSNIIVDRKGRPFLCDFGLYPDDATAPSDAPHLRGWWPYAAPELHSGEDAAPSSDLFSVAAVLYRIATRRDAFDAEAMDLSAKENGKFVPPQKINRKISSYLSFVIRQGLLPDPRRRYASAHAMQVDVKRVYKGQKPLAFTARRSPVLRAFKVLFYLVLFAGLLGSAGLWGYRWYDRRMRGMAEEKIEAALQAIRAGRFAEAAELVESIPRTYPKMAVRAYIVAARAALGGGDAPRALDLLRRASEEGREVSGKALTELSWLEAGALALIGKFDEASKVLSREDPLLFSKCIGEGEVCNFASTLTRVHSKPPYASLAADFLVSSVLRLAGSESARARVKLLAGLLLENAGDFKRAAGLFREALAGPEPLPAAAAEFRKWLEGLPGTDRDAVGLLIPYPDELARLALRRYVQGRLGEARRLVKALSKAGRLPETASRFLALFKAGEKALAGKSEEALSEYVELSLRDDEPGAWALLFASGIRLDIGQTGLAEKGLASLVEKGVLPDPLGALAYLYLGHCWRAKGKSGQAIGFYVKSRESTGAGEVRLPAALAELEAYCETRAMDLAKGTLENLRRIAPDAPETAAASFLLGEEASSPPSLRDPFHRRYIEALKYEISGRKIDAYQTYRLLVEAARGKSWYASAARFRLQILRQ